MIMFAVIAAVIVAAPISFLSLVPSAVSFSVADGNVYHIYPANFSNKEYCLHRSSLILNSSSMAYHGNYTDLSYFNASMSFFETYMSVPGSGAYTIFINYNFRGAVSSILHPTKVTATVSAFFQNNTSDNNFVVTTSGVYPGDPDPFEKNVSIASSDTVIWERGSGTVTYPLENSSSSTNNQKYYFCLANGSKPTFVNGCGINSAFPRGFWIFYNPPIVYNLTVDLTFMATSPSATLVDNFTIYLIDTEMKSDKI